ncbi:MAG: hypothetical protein ACYSWP_12840 [Planctomycetota bacterium]|jgi:hypothetical protein
MASELAKFRIPWSNWVIEILQGTMSGAEDIPDDRHYTFVSNGDMGVRYGYDVDRSYNVVVREFAALIAEFMCDGEDEDPNKVVPMEKYSPEWFDALHEAMSAGFGPAREGGEVVDKPPFEGEAPAIKIQANDLVNWVGMFRAWRIYSLP